MGVLVSVFYVTKIELFAGLPQDLPSLPSFGPEDVPAGLENVSHKEMDIIKEEGISVSQEVQELEEAEQKEQENFMMGKQDGEAPIEVVSLRELTLLKASSESGLEIE